MTEKLLTAGFEVTGVDVPIALLEMAKARYPTIEFVDDDIAEWVTPLRFDLILAWDSIFHLPLDSHVPVTEKLCDYLAEFGVLLFTAGGVESEIMGDMDGHEFAYSSLSDTALIELFYRGGCVPVLVERDQFPLHHLVVIAAQNVTSASELFRANR